MAETNTARRMWLLLEPIHALVYFAPQARAALEASGLRGFWRGYFAGRAAPLGAVGPAPVVALFYGFAPSMVERALPAVWQLASPARALAARLDGAVAALTAVADTEAPGRSSELGEAADLARRAASGAEIGGRALGAANAALDWPDQPIAALWHAATVLREVRGDGHVAALLTAGLSGLDAHVLRTASDLDRAVLQPARGWTDQEWEAAAANLIARGLLASDGELTAAGHDLLREVETTTDQLAAQPWAALGEEATDRLARLIMPISRAAAAVLPDRIPIGLPRPSAS